MKIGAYQFAVTKDMEKNLKTMHKAILQASQEGVSLLVFPECALTGYPPHDFESPADVDFDKLAALYDRLQHMSTEYHMHLIVGTIQKEEDKYYNTALLFSPDKKPQAYHKRALWGWDKDNFTEGSGKDAFEVMGLKIGVRICYEIRFPEFFRELYKEQTDLNVILFYDVKTDQDVGRFELMRSYIRVRADENVCNTLAINTAGSFQTAPTMLCDKSGDILAELPRHTEGMLVYDLQKEQLSFGEQGKQELSNRLLRGEFPRIY